MNKIELLVDKRFETGKGPARRLRAVGKAPAIFYGKKTEPINLAIKVHEFVKLMDKAGTNPLFELKIQDGSNITSRTAILKASQIRPVDGDLVHLDFLEVLMDQLIEVTVPIVFQGKPVGVEKLGEFHVLMRELQISSLPGNLPEAITVDISGLDIGHTIHVGEVAFPEGVSPIQDLGVALAAVVAPKKEEEAAEEVAEAAAPAAKPES